MSNFMFGLMLCGMFSGMFTVIYVIGLITGIIWERRRWNKLIEKGVIPKPERRNNEKSNK